MTSNDETGREPWPELPLEAWSDTLATLHRWLQIVGKIRLVQTPWINHGWHVALYVTGRGLTTSPIPYGSGGFQIDFDFCAHQLLIRTSDAREGQVPLRAQTTAAFYRQLWDELERLGLRIRINRKPNEVEDPIPFDQDEVHASYDPEYAHRFWRVLVQVDRVFQQFRARFIGKCSPIHLFWGAVDLATTRFSGRTAPEHPGGIPNLPDAVTREAYSHEVSSAGFWAGWRRGFPSRVLLVRLPGAAGLLRCARPAGGGILSPRAARIPAPLRRRPPVRVAGRHAAGIPAIHLRSRRQPCRLGPLPPGAQRRLAEPGGVTDHGRYSPTAAPAPHAERAGSG